MMAYYRKLMKKNHQDGGKESKVESISKRDE
jgi:hypothetical protein